jgi:hypothetical protein
MSTLRVSPQCASDPPFRLAAAGNSLSLEDMEPVMALQPHYSAKTSTPLVPASKTTIREEKIATMLALAEECGYVCEPYTMHRHEMILAILSRLVHREGTNVYQSVAFNLSFPMQAARNIFGRACLTTETSSCLTWKASTMLDVVGMLGQMLGEGGKNCSGLTRALTTDGEPTARALATLIFPLEISAAKMPRGVSRLYINFNYILTDEGGGLHYPKNNKRKELKYSAEMVSTFRSKVLADARTLVAQGAALSSGWLRLLGLNQHALTVEAGEADGKAVALPRPPKKKQRKNHGEVECILDERVSTGRAGAWLLVRWSGYHPAWERWRIHGPVGSPLETWEPICNLRNCTALQEWRAAK